MLIEVGLTQREWYGNLITMILDAKKFYDHPIHPRTEIYPSNAESFLAQLSSPIPQLDALPLLVTELFVERQFPPFFSSQI